MAGAYDVVVESGVLRRPDPDWAAPHRWTAEGVVVHGAFTGAHLLHLAVGGCVLNDVHREARETDVAVDGVRVVVTGDLDPASWTSTGIEYRVEVASSAGPQRIESLLDRVERVAEIPRALAAGTVVRRRPADA